jgi:signal transduction histidine kinase
MDNDHGRKIEDLAGRVHALEESLAREQRKTNVIFSSMTEGLVGIDANYQIVLMNQAASIMLRVAEGDALGKPIFQIMPLYKDGKELPKEESPVFQALSEQTIVRMYPYNNISIKDTGKEEAPIVLSVTSFLGRDATLGIAGIVMFRNIAAEKAVDKSKTEFVSLAAHQLRTPLSTISWYAEMLLSGDAGVLNEDQKEYITHVYESNKRMVALVNNLLNVSRVDLGTFQVNPAPTSFKEMVESLEIELKQSIDAKKQHFIKTIASDLPIVSADPTLSRMVIQNLLTNAIKYTPESGTIEVVLETKSNDLVIKVKDNGYGIPEADQGKMFTKLYRASNVTDKVTDGNGLGLYVIKNIVEQSGGTISFESRENQGTTFTVTIPLSGMKAKTGSKPLS